MNSNKIPAITVIIPVYNADKYLHQCIESVTNQTFTNFELLLIDDGSTDNSPDICDYFQSKDMRIKTFHKKNGGVSSARNLGIEEARGKWICFIDADDWVDEDYLDVLMKSVEGDNTFIVQGFNVIYDEKKKNSLVSFDEQVISSTEFNTLFSILELHKYGYPFSKLYNKQILNDNNIRFDYNISMSEDLIFMLQYLLVIDKIKFIENSCYFYRKDSYGLTSKVVSSFSSKKLYQSLSNLILKMREVSIDVNDGLDNLREVAAYALISSIVVNYVPGHVSTRRNRLENLRELSYFDLDWIKRYSKVTQSYMYVAIFFLHKKYFRFFDFYFFLVSKARILIKRVVA